ncbi:RNA polymerase sigma factor [Paenibacillus turicensis]|uniref:RNA polymerase sigma factor n=1 Tax=Paenibacillus turicensis TaxID=160487 RepID=UPI003D26FF24
MNPLDIKQAYSRYKFELNQYIYGLLKQQQDAEDLTQECFVRLMRYKLNVPEERLLYFLKRVARNLVIDLYRKRKYEFLRNYKLQVPTYHSDISQLEVGEGVTDLMSHISNIEHQKVLKLRVIDGYSIKETAQLMNRSEGMVKSSVFHAVNKIKANII